MPSESPLGPILLYLVGLAVVAAGIQLFWDMVWLALGMDADRASPVWSGATAQSPASALLWFLFSPLIVVAVLYAGSGITHLILMLLGGARRGFGTTLRVCAFSYGPQLFVIVPLVGWMIALVWSVVVTIVGLREAHVAAGWKPAVAVLAPIGCLVSLVVLFAVLVAVGTLMLPQM